MKIAIAGYGQEGKANYEYWNTPDNQLTIADEREQLDDLPDDVPTILGSDAFSKLADFDMVLRSPSVRPDKIVTKGKVWSSTNEFFEKCPAPIIGVTGTKGKGTTCSLITSILRAAGKTVHLVGNIGVPALRELETIATDHVVVYELSSFQLWDLEYSPHIAVVLMIEQDHMDVHHSMKEYVNAKARIVKAQSVDDSVFYCPRNEYSKQIAARSAAAKYEYDSEESVWTNGRNFVTKNGVIASVDDLRIPGEHNIQNACAAIAASLAYLGNDTYDQAVAEGLKEFRGLEHRLKFIAEVEGAQYYDDSISTTPGSAIAALHAFSAPKTIILGGSDKGSSYGGIVDECKATNSRVIAIGATGDVIEELCLSIGVVCMRINGGMNDAVAAAHEISQSGEVVLLSPASASFDMFKNYKDRGDQFIKAVQSL